MTELLFKLFITSQLIFTNALDSLKKVCPFIYSNYKPYKSGTSKIYNTPRGAKFYVSGKNLEISFASRKE